MREIDDDEADHIHSLSLEKLIDLRVWGWVDVWSDGERLPLSTVVQTRSPSTSWEMKLSDLFSSDNEKPKRNKAERIESMKKDFRTILNLKTKSTNRMTREKERTKNSSSVVGEMIDQSSC